MIGSQVGRERQARGLSRVQSCTDQQKCDGCADLTYLGRTATLAAEDEQGKGHDREAAVLQQRTEPDVRHAAPAEDRAVLIGVEAHEGAHRREKQGQRNHGRDEPGGHAEFDDHHAIERAVEQRERDADRDLEQRQTQQSSERQIIARSVCERQETRIVAESSGFHVEVTHRRVSSAPDSRRASISL